MLASYFPLPPLCSPILPRALLSHYLVPSCLLLQSRLSRHKSGSIGAFPVASETNFFCRHIQYLNVTIAWRSPREQFTRLSQGTFICAQLHTDMARAHYIVRVGNVGIAKTTSERAPNHWHYLSPQYLWGLPKAMPHVKVRAKFEADIENPRVVACIWFLCNSHGGPGHFVQVGIGRRHVGHGPVGNGNLPIPEDMMARLQQGFDHWFEWQPISSDAAFQDRLRQLPIPHPPYIPTLRHVTEEHPSFPLFQDLIDIEEQHTAAVTTALPADIPTPPAIEIDMENIRREQTEPHSQGYIYLIHMENTTFYKIGMSLDPEIRMRTLQTGNPHPLYLLNTQAVQDMRSAEVDLHRKFETQRVPNLSVREWFDLGDETGEVNTAFAALR